MKWMRVFVGLMLAGLTACASSQPPGSTVGVAISQAPSATNNPRINPDAQEVQDTGCDKPEGTTAKEATNTLGSYSAKLEVRRSDSAAPPHCAGLYWVRLTPLKLPADSSDKEFAAVLRIGNAGTEKMLDVARQDARPSEPKVELITKGKIVKPGQLIQACLVLLEKGQLSQNFMCTTAYSVP